jgi:hypothetical protein
LSPSCLRDLNRSGRMNLLNRCRSAQLPTRRTEPALLGAL